MSKVVHETFGARLLPHRVWFAFDLVRRDAPWWVKAKHVRGFYWVWRGRSHWVHIPTSATR